jgi:hypothetical protein
MSEILELLIRFRNYCTTIKVDNNDSMKWESVFGLCHATTEAWADHIFTEWERVILYRYIYKNRPKWYQKHYSFLSRRSNYFWKPKLWLPRILWLEYRIEKEREKQSTV